MNISVSAAFLDQLKISMLFDMQLVLIIFILITK